MIPQHWMPHRRPDGELAGYLVPEGDLVVPTSLIGHPLSPASDPAAARALIDRVGLAELNRRYFAEWPGEGMTTVVVIETSPSVVRFRREWGTPAELRETITVPNPAVDVLLLDSAL